MERTCDNCRFVELKPCNGICFYCDPASKDKWQMQYVDLDRKLKDLEAENEILREALEDYESELRDLWHDHPVRVKIRKALEFRAEREEG